MMNGKNNYSQAAIYVRVSSEHQGEKSSPDEQETDCRKLAEERGLTLVGVYRDTEKYRVGRKLVDPSGTRSDRPGLVAMLHDAAAGQFGTILAWREDRLYRGMRAMLLVLEAVQEFKLDVILARESFDPKLAPLKAWVAQMELDGMRERMTMGVKARLRAGKANTGQDRYGYWRNGENIEIIEQEAAWVQQIFAWYNAETPLLEIRRRLIEADAPQKGSSIPRRIHWSKPVIQGVLRGAKDYATGIKIQTRGGEAFEISIPPIISRATYQKFLEVREANKKLPVHHIKNDYLLLGLLYCECGRKWSSRTHSYTRKNRHGEKVERKSLYGVYFCTQCHEELIHSDCPRSIGSKKADQLVWQKVHEAIDKPEVLMAGARRCVNDLRLQAESILADSERFQKDLDGLIMERQWVITQARKGAITQEDMDYQLGALTFQELSLKKELAECGEIVRLGALDGWEDAAREYLADIQAGLEWHKKAAPRDEEERREMFEEKRLIVKTLVKRVDISRGRDLEVTFQLNIQALIEQAEGVGTIRKGGIYTHK
jgi:DNA invertase Pin-like site-specific DNA recombinase